VRWQIEGPHPLSDTYALTAAERASLAARLRALAQEPVIALLDDAEALQQAELSAAALRRGCDRLVVIGTGGASLGGQTLCALAPERERVQFLDNCDPNSCAEALSLMGRMRVRWLAISKSGETVETLATVAAVMEQYAREGIAPQLAQDMLVITGSGDSTLRRLAQAQGWRVLGHPEISGRYAAFTLVGLLPALVTGLDIAALRQGAVQWWVGQSDGEGVMQQAAWLAKSQSAYPVQVVMPYHDKLLPYTRWFQQLWAESLGKQGKGATPFAALGTIDQHSQLQLFLDGPRDKSFTLLLPKRGGSGPALSATIGVPWLAGRDIGAVMDASAEAIVATLKGHEVPLRVLRSAKLDAAALGELLLRHMVETVLAAALLGVDPYDQPAVEEGKRLTRALLEAMHE
jgi:glucose-6-phosphate isomerase